MAGRAMLLRMVVRSLVGTVSLGSLLVLPAGRLTWPQAWGFLALFIGGGLATGVWLHKADPGLLAERMRSPFDAAQRPRDRAVMAAVLVVCAAWLVAMGLDERFGWSRTPAWAQALGAALIVAAFCGFVWVLRVNSFAAVAVRVQAERGQTVVSDGPYALVRHPMYAFGLLLMAGVPLLLGSAWGLLGLLVFLPLLVARALGEEAVLMEGLPGYREYARKVRARLLPGIW